MWVGERDVSVLVALDGCFDVVGKGRVGVAGVGGGLAGSPDGAARLLALVGQPHGAARAKGLASELWLPAEAAPG